MLADCCDDIDTLDTEDGVNDDTDTDDEDDWDPEVETGAELLPPPCTALLA